MKKFLLSSLLAFAVLFSVVTPSVQAQITNPVTGSFGEYSADTTSGAQFVGYFVNIWVAMTTVGGLAVILFMIWGAFEWITAGGDAGKIGKARDKMTNAVIGLILLVSAFVIIGFVGRLFFGDEFDILNLDIPGVTNRTGGSGPGGGNQPSGNGSTTPNAPATVAAGQCVPQKSILSYRCASGDDYPSDTCGTGIRCKSFASDGACFDESTHVCQGNSIPDNDIGCIRCVIGAPRTEGGSI